MRQNIEIHVETRYKYEQIIQNHVPIKYLQEEPRPNLTITQTILKVIQTEIVGQTIKIGLRFLKLINLYVVGGVVKLSTFMVFLFSYCILRLSYLSRLKQCNHKKN